MVCSYTLLVSLSAGAFTNTVRLAVPLTVYVPPPANYVSYGAAPPDFWKPAVEGASGRHRNAASSAQHILARPSTTRAT